MKNIDSMYGIFSTQPHYTNSGASKNDSYSFYIYAKNKNTNQYQIFSTVLKGYDAFRKFRKTLIDKGLRNRHGLRRDKYLKIGGVLKEWDDNDLIHLSNCECLHCAKKLNK
ncbi:MAG: hypothetical protein V3W20_04475 [Candidatus Neomarinimicrobiota bacterium]